MQRELQIRHLLGYMGFTARLEHDLVNSVARRVARGDFGSVFSDEMKLDAYKLYCDEAYHALFSMDMQLQVESVTGIHCPVHPEPRFITEFTRQASARAHGEQKLVELLFAVVSETLITSTLVKVPKEKSVVEPIRAMVADHARDEAIHHKYFSELMRRIWKEVPLHLKRELGVILPDAITWFLQPDLERVEADLHAAGLDQRDARRVAAESYPRQRVAAEIRGAASPTLALFAEVGVTRESAVLDAFTAKGFVLP